MGGVPIFAVFIVVFGVILVINSFSKNTTANNFKTLADRLKIDFHYEKPDIFTSLFREVHPELSGLYMEQYPLRIHVIVEGSGKHRRRYIAFELETKSNKPHNLTLMHEGFFRKIGKAMGMQPDIDVRDEEFDQKFIVKSDNALFAKQVLADPDLRELFLNRYYLLNNAQLSFSGGSIRYKGSWSAFDGTVNSKIEGLVNLSVELARRLEETDNQSFTEYKEW
jgi:hypothetical protein